MNSRAILKLGLLLGSAMGALAGAQQPAETLDQLTRASHIIFVGRVVKAGASNVELAAASEATAVVRVEELLDAPANVAGIKGQDVTVQLLRAGGMKAEQRAVFFTNGVLFGQHLAVKEAGQLPVPADRAALKTQIAAVRTKIADEALQARIANATVVIVGKVLSVKDMPEAGPKGTEHEGDWAVAAVQIEAIEKGKFDGRTVQVYFPQSRDERWLLSPKFKVGEQGIWLLHHEPNLGLPESALSALRALDFHSLTEREKIRRLAR
jgi:hypothetical protein